MEQRQISLFGPRDWVLPSAVNVFPTAEGEKPAVLLIEDDAETAQGLASHFSRQGYDIVHATNGVDGLIKARANKFALMIVNRLHAEIDGASILQALRDGQDNVPIFVREPGRPVATRSPPDAVQIRLSGEERRQLENLVAAPGIRAKYTVRAQIVLLSDDGLAPGEIMRQTGQTRSTVLRWQARFAEAGIDGLLHNKPNPPSSLANRPPRTGPDQALAAE